MGVDSHVDDSHIDATVGVSCANSRRTALITGASRGIGAHLARGFLDAGFNVAVTSTSGGGFEALVGRDIPDAGRVLTFPLDVCDAEAVAEVVTAVERDFGSIDVLVNNAGIIETESLIWEADPDQWWKVLEVNVRGAFLMTQAVARCMIGSGGGRIINLNSGSGGSDSADLSAYHASKSALARITTAVTLAGADHQVRAFDLAPGVIRSDMTAGMALHKGRTDWTDPDDVVTLALALSNGTLDAYAGRMVRAGSDTVRSLTAAIPLLGQDERRLRWRGYGPTDPVVS